MLTEIKAVTQSLTPWIIYAEIKKLHKQTNKEIWTTNGKRI